MPNPEMNPSKDFDVDVQLAETSNAVNHYLDQINAKLVDFDHKALVNLQESLERAQAALVNHQFKKERPPIKFDATLTVLNSAVNVLSEIHEIEKIKAVKEGIYEDIENETTLALDAIEELVFLIEDFEQPREAPPIHTVDVKEDIRLKRGRKVKDIINEQFKDGKT